MATRANSIHDADTANLGALVVAWVAFTALISCLYHALEPSKPGFRGRHAMLVTGTLAGVLHACAASAQLVLVNLPNADPGFVVGTWGMTSRVDTVASAANSMFIVTLAWLTMRDRMSGRAALGVAIVSAVGTNLGTWLESPAWALLGGVAFLLTLMLVVLRPAPAPTQPTGVVGA